MGPLLRQGFLGVIVGGALALTCKDDPGCTKDEFGIYWDGRNTFPHRRVDISGSTMLQLSRVKHATQHGYRKVNATHMAIPFVNEGWMGTAEFVREDHVLGAVELGVLKFTPAANGLSVMGRDSKAVTAEKYHILQITEGTWNGQYPPDEDRWDITDMFADAVVTQRNKAAVQVALTTGAPGQGVAAGYDEYHHDELFKYAAHGDKKTDPNNAHLQRLRYRLAASKEKISELRKDEKNVLRNEAVCQHYEKQAGLEVGKREMIVELNRRLVTTRAHTVLAPWEHMAAGQGIVTYFYDEKEDVMETYVQMSAFAIVPRAPMPSSLVLPGRRPSGDGFWVGPADGEEWPMAQPFGRAPFKDGPMVWWSAALFEALDLIPISYNFLSADPEALCPAATRAAVGERLAALDTDGYLRGTMPVEQKGGFLNDVMIPTYIDSFPCMTSFMRAPSSYPKAAGVTPLGGALAIHCLLETMPLDRGTMSFHREWNTLTDPAFPDAPPAPCGAASCAIAPACPAGSAITEEVCEANPASCVTVRACCVTVHCNKSAVRLPAVRHLAATDVSSLAGVIRPVPVAVMLLVCVAQLLV
eukprot:TRINITY_DN1720_c0_g1_i4.p1 TRINITY_DN1720_c0_g1~~TRINITY_DN1720_c0_g1_i4.p1  ORF type:complete len:585 (+),score=118.80 TRINITY_DN1720_c0_g1_i4:95-1849(+)